MATSVAACGGVYVDPARAEGVGGEYSFAVLRNGASGAPGNFEIGDAKP